MDWTSIWPTILSIMCLIRGSFKYRAHALERRRGLKLKAPSSDQMILVTTAGAARLSTWPNFADSVIRITDKWLGRSYRLTFGDFGSVLSSIKELAG